MQGFVLGEQLCGRIIDSFDEAREDGCMNAVAYATPRRSSRVFRRVRIRAEGRGQDGRKFREVCETVVVNEHGGLLYLKHEVSDGALLVLANPETQDEQECRVVYLGEPAEKGQRVGVEFLTPAPHFWGIDFEPAAIPAESEKSDVH